MGKADKIDTKRFEIGIGIISLLWGAVLLMPWDSYSASLSYRILSQWISEDALGAIFATIGAARIIAALHGTYGWRAITGAVGMFHWLFMFFLFTFTNPTIPGNVMYGGATWLAVWIFIQVLKHHIYAHRLRLEVGKDARS